MFNIKAAFSALTKPAEEAAIAEEKYVGGELAAGAWSDKLYSDILSNPATLIRDKGLGVIDEMIEDDAIGSALSIRRAARLSTPTSIEAASDSNIDLEIAEFVRWVLYEFCETPMHELLNHIYSAHEYGFSLSEKVATLVDDGPHKGKIAYARFVPQNPHHYTFKLENGRRVAKNGIMQRAGYGKPKALPAAKFILYSYNPKWGNPYGKSDVAPCYPWFIIKKYYRRFWAIYGERTASGFLDAAFDANIGQKEQEKLKKMLGGISAATYMMHPDGIVVDLKESNGVAGDTYPKAINNFNIFMSRRLLTPDLLGFSAQPTGSYALGKTHLDVYVWVLEAMATAAREIVRNALIKNLVVWNYGTQFPLPRMVFDPLTGSAKLDALSAFFAAVKNGVFRPEDVTDEIREWILKTITAPHNERPEEQSRNKKSVSSPPIDPKPAQQIETAEEFASAGFGRRLSPIESKVSFSEIQKTFDSFESYTIETWRAIAIEQRDELLKHLKKKQIIEQKDVRAVAEIKFRKVGEIEKLLASTMVSAYLNGQWLALKELKAGGLEMAVAPDILLEPLTPAEAVKWFKAKGLKITATTIKGYSEEAFSIAGAENYKMLARCKAAIYRGIRDGNYFKTEAEIEKLFDGYVQTGEMKAGKLSEAWHVKTVVQTNVSSALGAARRNMFEDPDVSGEIEAYMISAVLDGNTTDHCIRFDQKIVTKDELAAYGWPPYHFNCRTIVVPIIRGEKFQITGIPAGLKQQFGPDGVKVT